MLGESRPLPHTPVLLIAVHVRSVVLTYRDLSMLYTNLSHRLCAFLSYA